MWKQFSKHEHVEDCEWPSAGEVCDRLILFWPSCPKILGRAQTGLLWLQWYIVTVLPMNLEIWLLCLPIILCTQASSNCFVWFQYLWLTCKFWYSTGNDKDIAPSTKKLEKLLGSGTHTLRFSEKLVKLGALPALTLATLALHQHAKAGFEQALGNIVVVIGRLWCAVSMILIIRFGHV